MMPASCCSRCAVLYAAEACRSNRWRSSGVRSRIPWSNGVGLGCRLHLRLGWIRSGGSSCRMTPCEKSSGLPVSSSMSSGLGESGGTSCGPSLGGILVSGRCLGWVGCGCLLLLHPGPLLLRIPTWSRKGEVGYFGARIRWFRGRWLLLHGIRSP